jgi:hypothetical protein
MPRFYFDVGDGRATIKDDEGLEMPDADAACEQAAVAAAEMVKSLVPCEEAELMLRVRDEDGCAACEIRVAVRVTRH